MLDVTHSFFMKSQPQPPLTKHLEAIRSVTVNLVAAIRQQMPESTIKDVFIQDLCFELLKRANSASGI
jgi:hypothetical protein